MQSQLMINFMKMKNRSISEGLMEILKKDYLKITEYVRISPYLDMEMRGNCVMVYYRGGKILTIFENKKKWKDLM